ncbi:hypothetical protein J2Z65_001458 [Paenibacillus aceris]|uniref:Uncharacterized protein n=1 Tax=Paenibacillus aceris TaxID=869555 RepID=A0ABS4HWD0_9BACL|nr:hypothetical protein [Paenibacillus aceris]
MNEEGLSAAMEMAKGWPFLLITGNIMKFVENIRKFV